MEVETISYYGIGFGLIITSFVIIILALIIYFLDPFVHSWILWFIFILIVLMFIGFALVFTSPVEVVQVNIIK